MLGWERHKWQKKVLQAAGIKWTILNYLFNAPKFLVYICLLDVIQIFIIRTHYHGLSLVLSSFAVILYQFWYGLNIDHSITFEDGVRQKLSRSEDCKERPVDFHLDVLRYLGTLRLPAVSIKA